jgi:hypothetical protein
LRATLASPELFFPGLSARARAMSARAAFGRPDKAANTVRLMSQVIGEHLDVFAAAPETVLHLLLRLLSLLTLDRPEFQSDLRSALHVTTQALALADPTAAANFCDDLLDLASGARA